MRMTVRRYRRRRTGSDSLGFAQSRFSAPFFDRLVHLSQSINQMRKPDVPFMILVSHDRFLCTGFQHSPSPLSHCCNYDTLENAISAVQLWPSARLVVDIESRISPLTELLDPLRRLALYPPYTPVNLLVRGDDYDGRLFCKAAGPFNVIERQLPSAQLQHTLTNLAVPVSLRGEWFSREEWAILRYLSSGESLRHIALLRGLPYSRIVYRVGRILAKLGLHHRQELLHLLNRLSE